MENQVFISYRRKDGFYPAYLLYKDLISKGYSVFFDLKSIRSGEFPQIIKQNIENCLDFIIIVTESTFGERIYDNEDWIHKEISLALRLNKNIVPIFINSEIPSALPDDIKNVRIYNGIQQIDPNLISENFNKLSDNFMIASPAQTVHANPVTLRCSAYDVDYGDEVGRLKVQSENSFKADKTVLDGLNGGVVLDVGSAYGSVTLSRFGGDKYTKILGIDKNAKSVDYCNANSPPKFVFRQMDVEANDFKDKLQQFMDENGVGGFDIIFASLVMHHLANPYAALRKLRKFLAPGGKIIVRGSDDGSKLCHPDAGNLMGKIIEKTMRAEGVSDRVHGRKIFDWLHQTGYRDVKIYSFMRDTSAMDMDGRENLFRESFSYRINYYKHLWEINPQDINRFNDFDEMETLLAQFENEFMKDQFWYCEYDYIGVAGR